MKRNTFYAKQKRKTKSAVKVNNRLCDKFFDNPVSSFKIMGMNRRKTLSNKNYIELP